MALGRRDLLKTLAGASVGVLGLPLTSRTHAQTTKAAPTKKVEPPLAEHRGFTHGHLEPVGRLRHIRHQSMSYVNGSLRSIMVCRV